MTRNSTLLGAAVLGAGLIVTAAACGRPAAPAGDAAAPAVITVGPENTVTVTRQRIRVGPSLSGELQPAREATVRAEVGGSVLEVHGDEGQAVARGALIGRIEALAIRDGVLSAQSGVRSAEQALNVARREAERVASLVRGGALAERDLELAGSASTAAEAQLADARARLASAQKLLDATTIRAPIAGLISHRAVNAGDVIAPGGELVTIIDPSSMRLEAAVPSEALSSLAVGAPVEFSVRGFPGQSFTGRIERLGAMADRVTRQVPIFVAIPNAGGRLLAGLFAEGRVITETHEALAVPLSAVNLAGQTAWVMRLRAGRAERVELQLGARDDRTEQVEVRSGLAEGDVLLGGAAQAVTPGTPVKVVETSGAGAR